MARRLPGRTIGADGRRGDSTPVWDFRTRLCRITRMNESCHANMMQLPARMRAGGTLLELTLP